MMIVQPSNSYKSSSTQMPIIGVDFTSTDQMITGTEDPLAFRTLLNTIAPFVTHTTPDSSAPCRFPSARVLWLRGREVSKKSSSAAHPAFQILLLWSVLRNANLPKRNFMTQNFASKSTLCLL
jgi:hypothetical protein